MMYLLLILLSFSLSLKHSNREGFSAYVWKNYERDLMTMHQGVSGSSLSHLSHLKATGLTKPEGFKEHHPYVSWHEAELDNIPVFNHRVSVLHKNGQPIKQAGPFPLRLTHHHDFEVSFVQALDFVLQDAFDLEASALPTFDRSVSINENNDYMLVDVAGLPEPVRARKVYFQIAEKDDGVVPAYYFEVWAEDANAVNSGELTLASYVIKASEAPTVLFYTPLKHHAFTFRTYIHDGLYQPSSGPYNEHITPNPGLTIPELNALFENNQLVTIPDPNPLIVTGDPWLPANPTDTAGNNVEAYGDTNDNNLPDDIRAPNTAADTFDYTFDPTVAADGSLEQQRAGIVTMFYGLNWIHDMFYNGGFTEAFRNAQADNFGRGGVQNDPILAEADDGGGNCNANMATPTDGSSPRTQMYLCNIASPTRTTSISHNVIAHEAGHYIHIRLGGQFANPDSGSMSEGFADYIAMLTTIPAGADTSLSYAVGVYAFNNVGGIRPAPYSTDMGVNSYTAADYPSQVAPHGRGFVWCTALFEFYASLLNTYTFAEAQERAIRYLVNGMKLANGGSSIMEYRQLLIDAATAESPEDGGMMCLAFAKRGFGSAADPPNGVADFSADDCLKEFFFSDLTMTIDDAGCNNDGVLDFGEYATLHLTIDNTDGQTADTFDLVFGDDSGGLVIYPNGNAPSVTVGAGAVVDVDVVLRYGNPDTDQNPGIGSVTFDLVNRTRSVQIEANYDEVVFATYDFTGGSIPTGWSESVAAGSNPWTFSNGYGFFADVAAVSSSLLASPTLLDNISMTIEFTHTHSFEGGYDGGLVELSDDNGASWTNVVGLVDGVKVTGVISSCCGSPIGGEEAFTGASQDHPTPAVNSITLAPTNSGVPRRLRFHGATDSSVPAYGWEIHNVRVLSRVLGSVCNNAPATTSTTGETSVSPTTGTSSNGGENSVSPNTGDTTGPGSGGSTSSASQMGCFF